MIKERLMKAKQSASHVFSITMILALGMIMVSADAYGEDQISLVEKVDPFIGTDGHGHTYPGVSLPFGMVQLSPDTGDSGWDWCSGYHYSDHSIMGFSHTHLEGTGCGDYGDFLFMPTTGTPQFTPGSKENPDKGYRSRFSHDREKASPGFYAVHLDDYNIDVQLTATMRVGVHRYLYPKTQQANVVLDLAHAIGGAHIQESRIEIINDRQVCGFIRKNGWSPNRYLYFMAEFSRPFETSSLRIDGQLGKSAKKAEGKILQCVVQFDTTQQQEVLVKVALSSVSCDGAARNMKAECPGWDFEKIRTAAKQSWQQQLSKITVKGGSIANQRVFYTALYHSCLAPNLFMDVDSQYCGTDKKIHTAEKFENYTVFSLWDTFRAEHPLFTLIEQRRTNDFINSMLGKYEQSGLLPHWELASGETWCMIGYHAVPVIADAWAKGIRGYDAQEALQAMKKSAMQDRRGMGKYGTLGYIPIDKEPESVSRTVESAYDDWCIAMMAEGLGEKDDFSLFSRRSQNYRNVFDRSVGLVRGKDSNGIWKPNFNPDDLPADGAREFTEGNSWHYTFFAPHDVNGLIRLLGGDQAFINKMDELFARPGREHMDVSGQIGQYTQGNEPCHNFAYLYAYAGAPWKTQARVSQIVKTLYTDRPDGLCGNEDCGQMSAWYVFNAMGMYPVCPGQPVYVFGTPLFPSTCINLENGKTFEMSAENLSDENIYIQSVTLNGKPYTKSYIQHADIISGGKLVFKMGSMPNKQWGLDKEDRPYSPPAKELTLMPHLSNASAFVGEMKVDIQCDDAAAKIVYTLDGSEPDSASRLYTQPFTINQTTTIKAKAYKDGALPSYTLSANLTKRTLKPAQAVTDKLENGMTYTYHVGEFKRASDMANSASRKHGKCKGFDLSVAEQKDNFGLVFSGYLKIEKEGIYQFWTCSDDGSQLFIDSDLVVDNDGPHGAQFASGTAALAAGYHEIKVLYFEGPGSETLEVDMAVPGDKREPLNPRLLFCK